MEAKLISIDLCSPQREFALDDLPVMIGRCADAGVRLDDPTVSCRHCEIEEMEGILVVRDLRSRNGTYVNGQRITEALLMPGHHLALGKTSFLVCYECAGATSLACAEHEEAYQCQESQ